MIAALLEGQSVSAVARKYKIDRATVIRWREKAGIDRTPVAQERLDFIGELTLEYLRETLTTLAVQQRTIFREEAWLRSQGADDLAVLHGIGADKAYRLLEALEAGSDQDDESEGSAEFP